MSAQGHRCPAGGGHDRDVTSLYGQERRITRYNPVANAHFEDYVQRPLSMGLFARREHIEQFVSRAKETIAKSKEPWRGS